MSENISKSLQALTADINLLVAEVTYLRFLNQSLQQEVDKLKSSKPVLLTQQAEKMLSNVNRESYDIGQELAGGYYVGELETYGLIVSPKNMTVRNCTQDIALTIKTPGYGYDDWYVPNLQELKLIYKNVNKLPVEQKLDPAMYWSSTEGKLHKDAFCLDFSNGEVFRFTKQHYMRFRPVRKILLAVRP